MLVGHVTDATTGQPLTNVTIAIGSHKTTTDENGNYRLAGLPLGPYTTRLEDVYTLAYRWAGFY